VTSDGASASGVPLPPHESAASPKPAARKRPRIQGEKATTVLTYSSIFEQFAGTRCRKIDVPIEALLRRATPRARVSTLTPDLEAYSRDLWPRGLLEIQSGKPRAPVPRAVVWPESVEDVARLVALANTEGLSLVPYGAGSGVCGGVRAEPTSVIVDLKRLDQRRLEPGPSLSVGAGMLGITLENELLEQGFTIGHYPSSILCSTVGGWVAARGAGQCSTRYGKIEDMVTSVEAVLGNGEVLTAKVRAHGPNLVPLLVGSEGTLGIITRATLRLHPAPLHREFAAYAFETLEGGVNALRELLQAGVRPTIARLYDPIDTVLFVHDDDHARPPRPEPTPPGTRSALLRAVLKKPALLARALGLLESSVMRRAALILVHEGSPEEAREQARRADAICRARAAPLGEGPARAWFRHRYSVSYRQAPLFRGGAFSDTMEVAAPWSRVLGVYEAVRRAVGEHCVVMAHLSHAYPDGSSLYFTFAGTEHGGESSLEVYERAWRAALGAAVDAGATLSHHHGVGRSKAPRLAEELGAGTAVVRALKRAWDPAGLLNPGALIPEPGPREARIEPAPSTEPSLDRESALAGLPGTWTLAECERFVHAQGHTLGLDFTAFDGSLGLGEWIARGLPGTPDRFEDPVRAPISGFTARLHDGRRIAVPAAPRRAVGPDLLALFAGMRHSVGHVEHAALVALPIDAPRPPRLPFTADRDPPLDAGERGAITTLCAALGVQSKV
jgi:alkyldihydroxyacetonephosphate synthase